MHRRPSRKSAFRMGRKECAALLKAHPVSLDADMSSDKILQAIQSDAVGRKIQNPGGKYHVSSREARTSGGVTFDSKWEMQVHDMLRARIPGGHLHLQPGFVLLGGFLGPDGRRHRGIRYVGDFLLGPERGGESDPLLEEHVLIDCKGMETDVFKIKHKLFMSLYGKVIHRPRTGQMSKVMDIADAYLAGITR